VDVWLHLHFFFIFGKLYLHFSLAFGTTNLLSLQNIINKTCYKGWLDNIGQYSRMSFCCGWSFRHVPPEHLIIINISVYTMYEQGNHNLSNIHMIFYQHLCKMYELLVQLSCKIRFTCCEVKMKINHSSFSYLFISRCIT